MNDVVRVWTDDLSRSARDFVEVVWPHVGPLCGRGVLRPVEGVTDGDMSRTLDMMAGIDAWQIVEDRGVRGVGSRIQWITQGKPYDTFTIRYARDSGAETEFKKRLRALDEIDKGWLYPHLTIQAYVTDGNRRSLLSAAVIPTRELYEVLRDEGVDGVAPVPKYERYGKYGLERTSNASFLVVNWYWLVLRAKQMTLWHPRSAIADKPKWYDRD